MPHTCSPTHITAAKTTRAAAFALILLCAAACKPTKETVFAPEPPLVETITLVATDIPVTHEWVATLDGSANAVIRAQVSGYLLKQLYDDGAFVRKGDPLFEIDARPFEATLSQTRATLAQAEAQAGKTAQDVERYKPLAATEAISRQELDDAVQANLAAQAQVAAARAQIEKANIELGFTKILAPIDGLAGPANVGIGDLVSPLSQPLATISAIDPIRAYFSPSEQEYLRYKQHQAATAGSAGHQPGTSQPPPATLTLLLSDGTRYAHAGIIEFIDREVDSRTGSIRLAGSFPNPERQLRPGMFARLRAVTETRTAAIAVPQRAVIEMQGTYQVLVYSPDAGTAAMRPITLGERLRDQWVVLSGLQAGEQIVVEGIQRARPGIPLRAKPYEGKAEGLKN